MKRHFPLFLLGALVLFNIFVWDSSYRTNEGLLSVSFLDVGQGDAIFIESPSGVQVLIDGGIGNSVLRELGKVMSFEDRSIDLLIATHPDADHIGGFPEVLNNYNVETYIDSGAIADTGVYREVERLVDAEGATELVAKRGMLLDLGAGAIMTILFPDRDMVHSSANDASVIAKLEYGENTFLLTGDAPKTIEEYVSSLDGEYLDVDVLKVGHHGSKTSTAEEFIQFVTPEYAVISAGKDNRYGHPHEEVLNRLQYANVLGTYEDGTITFLSDGEKLWIQ